MRRLFVLLLLFVLVTACVKAGEAPRAAQDAAVQTSFEFSGWAGPAIRVWYQKPVRVSASTPIVFVMHGVRRDADRYLAEWAPIAQRNGFILVVPEFSQADFPGSRGYNEGYLREKDGSLRPRSHWSFASIEPLFDEIKARTGTRSAAFALYGHSAGAQFVHRYVLLMPEARLSRAITANAGWYTMPDLEVDYPYGLAGTGVDEPALKRTLTKPLAILLGTADSDQGDPNLRTTLDANAQGPHRYARGLNFHRHAEAAAARAGVPFGWRLLRVPGVGHSNSKMAISAAPLLAK